MRFEDWLEDTMREDYGYLPYMEANDRFGAEDEYIVLEREFAGESRWTVDYRTVFKHRTYPEYWAVIFETPATEMQDGMDVTYEIEGRVKPVEVVKTIYKRV